MSAEVQYLNMCHDILKNGTYRKPEGEEGRYELFGQQIRCDLNEGKLPLLTTKKMPTKHPFVEMLWFISGSQYIDYLHANGVYIWDTWADENNLVGPLYGYMWRHWAVDPRLGGGEIDQLQNTIKSLRDRPEARSHMVLAWRPDWVKAQSIKPCHVLLQFYRIGDKVSLMMTQRSCDTFLGVPFNLAQYAFLTHAVAHVIGCEASEFIWNGGDVHIYENHVEQIEEQIFRTVRAEPTLKFDRKVDDIDELKMEDFSISGYNPHPRLKGDVSPQGTPGNAIDIEKR